MTAATACRTCGTEPREGARFCDGCGAPITEPDVHAEYKQVTVLFADVVHSMGIAATLDVERLREIMTKLLEQSAAVVQRYGGGKVEYTGDGIMGLFGAPIALEDHAFRACLAAHALQEETAQLAAEVERRDGVALQLRVGLSSGRVIAGSGALGYVATGEAVGFAQRMESAAPPGGVMLSESTARLVEHTVTMGEPEWVRIKGVEEPVPARRLLGIGLRDGLAGRAETNLVGRRGEMSTIEGLLNKAVQGSGGVVRLVGSPGIGKSRLMRELAATARRRNVDVFATFCESHAAEVPFRVVARLLRTVIGVEGLAPAAARAQVHARLGDADPEDVTLFDDLLGIADPEVELPKIDPDARRRRLTALVNAASLARQA
ncbi:adenylate/guanylate cyclase domain-containing protein, partial [Mycobacterium sp.]|uniref:adenylate/guanylate cyclase domain-containing protein n=1 Tax=Mycobacterium sp. TaxID=1785 RepID=UPI003C77E388